MDQEENNKPRRYQPFHQKKSDEVRGSEIFEGPKEDRGEEIKAEEVLKNEKPTEDLNFSQFGPLPEHDMKDNMNNDDTPQPEYFIDADLENSKIKGVEEIVINETDIELGVDPENIEVEIPNKVDDVELEIVAETNDAETQFNADSETIDEPSAQKDQETVTDITKFDPLHGSENNHNSERSKGELKTYGSEIYKSQTNDDPSLRKEGRMGDQMIAQGIINEDQLNVALQEKKVSDKMLGEILVELGFITEQTLMAFIAATSDFGLFDPKSTIVDGDALALLEKTVAAKQRVLPVSINGNDVHVAMVDPYDVVAMDTLRAHFPKGARIKAMLAAAQVIDEAIDAAYGYSSSINAILKELEGEEDLKDVATLNESEAFSHPVVRLVNALVSDAVKIGASDLHFEPEENFIRLRYRVDGVLYTAQTLHKQHWNSIAQRIKILCDMNIADKINAQDGRFGIDIGGREVDFRVSSLPTVHGENIVLRVLDKSSSIMALSDLGFSDHNLDLIKKSQSKPEGIIIVTGPTGSGKTTSLYSMINEINTVDVNIQTLEDPVEYSLPMIRQTAVREGILDFADGIKALLRQDPDIIFIGEVRDKTTAEMALKAAMTGHQVYTTLHTNDSFGAIPRLLDLGLKPGMISGAIVSVFAQRLTRRLCGSCKEEYTPDATECELLGVDPANPPSVFRARQGGCGTCGGQGYKGRTAVVEILSFDEDMDEILAKGADKVELKKEAIKKGFKSMKDDGILKILDGVTDIEALSKVVDITR